MENSECTQRVAGLGSMMSEASAGGPKRGLESPASSFPQVSAGDAGCWLGTELGLSAEAAMRGLLASA